MMDFIDGPAAGVNLMLSRAPFFLRVVKNPLARKDESAWDALNMTDDVAKPREQIFVYILAAKPQAVHLSMRPRSRSGWFWMGKYRFLDPQPPEHAVRANGDWGFWCEANRDRLMPEWNREAAGPAEVDA